MQHLRLQWCADNAARKLHANGGYVCLRCPDGGARLLQLRDGGLDGRPASGKFFCADRPRVGDLFGKGQLALQVSQAGLDDPGARRSDTEGLGAYGQIGVEGAHIEREQWVAALDQIARGDEHARHHRGEGAGHRDVFTAWLDQPHGGDGGGELRDWRRDRWRGGRACGVHLDDRVDRPQNGDRSK